MNVALCDLTYIYGVSYQLEYSYIDYNLCRNSCNLTNVMRTYIFQALISLRYSY